jgi:ribosome-associated toxin RatA of RatAB toxin-antitoxin module
MDVYLFSPSFKTAVTVTANTSAMSMKLIDVFHLIEMEWKFYLLTQTSEVTCSFS